jgi:signal peptidase I
MRLSVLGGLVLLLSACTSSQASAPPVLSTDLVTVTMDGAAMEPTVEPGMSVTVNRGVSIHRGDVVLIRLPDDSTSIRRIVAVAGEVIEIFGNHAPPYLAVSEPGSSVTYASEEIYISPDWTVATSCCGADGKASRGANRYLVPAGYVYVLSDNRNETKDSRTFGALPSGSIRGRVLGDPRLPTPYSGEPWHRTDSTTPTNSIHTYAGPSHCGLQSGTFLNVGWPIGHSPGSSSDRVYVRDPEGKLARDGHLLGDLDLHATLPSDARDTGFRAASIRLYLSPKDQDRYAYLVGVDRVERWPRSDPPVGCA